MKPLYTFHRQQGKFNNFVISSCPFFKVKTGEPDSILSTVNWQRSITYECPVFEELLLLPFALILAKSFITILSGDEKM